VRPKPDSKLVHAREIFDSIGSNAMVAIERGTTFAAWGSFSEPSLIRSVRKSICSALIGIAVDEGAIDLNATLAQLDIDDIGGLSAEERTATIRHLIQSRSGIYHRTASELAGTEERRPARGSHPPGTHYWYNNWDFNVLGTIYERATGNSVFEGFVEKIARPLGMEDVGSECDVSRREEVSEHTSYRMALSARDLARFGQLYARGGIWDGRVVVPPDWIAQSVTPRSFEARVGMNYGYMWWIGGGSSGIGGYDFWGAFGGSNVVAVIPALETVLVHTRVELRPGWSGVKPLFEALLTARKG
jgi:CubicO group peptidase (beta-lactamase class C family)